jgi:hypothetical protein
MREADSMLFDLKRSRADLLDYKNNIERQLEQAQSIINIALEQDLSDGGAPLTEQDAVWHNYLLKIFIDIKNNLRIIDSAIRQCEENVRGGVSAQESEALEPAR